MYKVVYIMTQADKIPQRDIYIYHDLSWLKVYKVTYIMTQAVQKCAKWYIYINHDRSWPKVYNVVYIYLYISWPKLTKDVHSSINMFIYIYKYHDRSWPNMYKVVYIYIYINTVICRESSMAVSSWWAEASVYLAPMGCSAYSSRNAA